MSLKLSLKIGSNGVGSTTAEIYYEISGITFPTGSFDTDWKIVKIQIKKQSDSNIKRTWGNLTVTNLSQGEEQKIQGSVEVKLFWKTNEIDALGQSVITNHESYPTATDSIIIYTHPGSFSFGASADSDSPNNIIANVLTANRIEDWAEHYNKVYHWKYQTNKDYKNLKNLKVSSNDVITASWYNNCVKAMKEVDRECSTVTGGATGTVITAELINDLNFYGV